MAGEVKENHLSFLLSNRAASTAFLRAKYTEAPKNNGGSPTPKKYLGEKTNERISQHLRTVQRKT